MVFVKSDAQQNRSICFHCAESSHIRPRCNKLKEDLKNGKIVGYEQTTIEKRIEGKTTTITKLWIRKSDMMREDLEVSMVEKKKPEVVKT